MEVLCWCAGIGNLHVVLGGEGEKSVEARAGVFGTRAFEAVWQQKDKAAQEPPFVLRAADELVDNYLGDVDKIAKLRFPNDQRERIADHGMAYRAEMHAHLMRTTGLQPAFEQRGEGRVFRPVGFDHIIVCDRLAAPVVADRLKRCRRGQSGKPIAVGEHVDKRVDRLGMFDPPEGQHRLLPNIFVLVFQRFDQSRQCRFTHFDQRVDGIVFELVVPQLQHERIKHTLVANLSQCGNCILPNVPIAKQLDQQFDCGRTDLSQPLDRNFTNLPVPIA